jgi:septal ring factor EnvC (AmiA/AmiB activator)
MLRYKSDVLFDANNGQGKIVFKASRIESPCVITSPNIEAMQARLDRLEASASTGAADMPAAPMEISSQDTRALEQMRADIVTLLARQDALDAMRASLEDKLARSSSSAASPTAQNPVFNARLNTVSDDIARLSSVIERLERRLTAIEAASSASTVSFAPVSSVSAEQTAPPTIPAVPTETTDEVKRITTPDGRVITLRRTQQAKAATQSYAW